MVDDNTRTAIVAATAASLYGYIAAEKRQIDDTMQAQVLSEGTDEGFILEKYLLEDRSVGEYRQTSRRTQDFVGKILNDNKVKVRQNCLTSVSGILLGAFVFLSTRAVDLAVKKNNNEKIR